MAERDRRPDHEPETRRDPAGQAPLSTTAAREPELADEVAEAGDRAGQSVLESHAEAEGLGSLGPAAIETLPEPPKQGLGVAFWLASGWIGLVVFSALFADLLPLPDPNDTDIRNRLAPMFSEGHLLGTDGLGRDTLARLMFGARVSLVVGLAAVGTGMLVGGTLGMTVGYVRGRAETLVMLLVDVILAFPALVLLLLLVAFLGQNLPVIAMVIGFVSIPIYTRVARANTLTVAQREFVLAAEAMGATKLRILFREIMPNVVLPVATFGLIALGVVIVAEGALAFLGLSVQPPTATWGSMIGEGRRFLLFETVQPVLIPSTVLFLTVLSLNFVGDKLRSRFDVREANI